MVLQPSKRTAPAHRSRSSGCHGESKQARGQLRDLPVAFAGLLADELGDVLRRRGFVGEGFHAGLALRSDAAEAHGDLGAVGRDLPELVGIALAELKSPCAGRTR